MTKYYCPERRTFLKTLAVMGGAVAALPTVMKSVTQPATANSSVLTTESQGYKETEHIRKYYKTAGL